MPAPRILLRQVKDTAPWLWPVPVELRAGGLRPAQVVDHPLGWWRVLDAAADWRRLTRGDGTELADYLALCLACHHASVATPVPTDVDSKIRGHLWRLASTPKQLDGLYQLLIHSLQWDAGPCSRRILATVEGPISGHDGERLACLAGVYGLLLQRDCAASAQDAAARIDAELARSARLWRRDDWSLRDRCRLSAILAHNAGDVDQGLGYWPKQVVSPMMQTARQRWGKLAKAAAGPGSDPQVASAFAEAAAWYRGGMAAEGHRNYPLRAIPALRRHADFLLPMAPFLEEWGGILATHPCLNDEERVEILGGIIQATRAVAKQRGYQRAIRGFLDAHPHPTWILDRLPVACANILAEPEVADLVNASPQELEDQLCPVLR
ncbi:MAG: hypothetical protein EA401_02190 [Planctomycetota bacterium]|nr:MAG: hypothetical protein EA401_02190 [Planctomycetota bacterium]